MHAVVKGKEIPVNWMWLFEASGQLTFEVTDARPVSEIAADFENAPVIERKSAEEGDRTYTGYTSIKRILAEKTEKGRTVQITLVKEE